MTQQQFDFPKRNLGGFTLGISFGPCGEPRVGRARPQVYQALSSRAGGEILSSDAS